MRERFLFWLCRKAGIPEGCRLPGWLIVVKLVLFPSRIRWWCASTVYDLSTDTIKVGKERITLCLLEQMFGPPYPKPWLRILGPSEYGLRIKQWYGPPDMPDESAGRMEEKP